MIKFRVWDEKRKKFIPKKDYHLITIRLDGTPQFWTNDDVLLAGGAWPEEIYKLEQFTGMKDSLDKDIYDGDIVELDEKKDSVIRFVNGAWALSEKRTHLWVTLNRGVKVIGNIRENPELLNAPI